MVDDLHPAAGGPGPLRWCGALRRHHDGGDVHLAPDTAERASGRQSRAYIRSLCRTMRGEIDAKTKAAIIVDAHACAATLLAARAIGPSRTSAPTLARHPSPELDGARYNASTDQSCRLALRRTPKRRGGSRLQLDKERIGNMRQCRAATYPAMFEGAAPENRDHGAPPKPSPISVIAGSEFVNK